MNKEDIDFKDYFVVDPNSPTGLRWRDDVVRRKEGTVGGNIWGGKPAGYRKSPSKGVKYTVVIVDQKRYIVSRII